MIKGIITLLFIFISDMLLPFGIAIGILYTCGLFLIVKQSERNILAYAFIASILMLVKFFMFFHIDMEYYIPVNRGISILAVWTGAIIAVKYKLTEERQSYIQKIEQKNVESEQLIYITTHDLNEPLRTVKAMSELLEKQYSDKMDEEGRTILRFIVAATNRMGNLIKAFLDYGRLGQIAIWENVDCNCLLVEVKADLQQIINESHTTIKTGKLPELTCVSNELRLLFQNLLSNAIKFRKPGVTPEIEISAARDNNRWQFAVSDNGIGIDPVNFDNIFVIFKRLHAKDTYEGTGIGLAHCKKILQLHNGNIWVNSKLSKGSTFHFTIPIN